MSHFLNPWTILAGLFVVGAVTGITVAAVRDYSIEHAQIGWGD